jgi:hypothetical protein
MELLVATPKLTSLCLMDLYHVIEPESVSNCVIVLPSLLKLELNGSDKALLLLLSTVNLPAITDARLKTSKSGLGFDSNSRMGRVCSISGLKSLKRLQLSTGSSVAYELLSASGISELERMDISGWGDGAEQVNQGMLDNELSSVRPELTESISKIRPRDLEIGHSYGLFASSCFANSTSLDYATTLTINSCRPWSGVPRLADIDQTHFPMLESITFKNPSRIQDIWLWLVGCTLPRLATLEVALTHYSDCKIDISLSQNAIWPHNVKGLAIHYERILPTQFNNHDKQPLLSANYLSSIFARATCFSLTIKTITLLNILSLRKGIAILELAIYLRRFFTSHRSEQDVAEYGEIPEAGNPSGIFEELESIEVAIGDVMSVKPMSDDPDRFTREMKASAYEESVVLMSFVKELLDVIRIRQEAGCPLKTVTISFAQEVTDLISEESDWIAKLEAFSSAWSQ